jgi:hypothetical protein
MSGRHSDGARAPGDDPAAGPEKKYVCQLLDLESFESEAPHKSRLAIPESHKADAITRFPYRRNPSSLLHMAALPLKSILRA